MKKKIIQRTKKHDKLNSTMQHLVKKESKQNGLVYKTKTFKTNKIYQTEENEQSVRLKNTLHTKTLRENTENRS